jgi:hypothetical protein
MPRYPSKKARNACETLRNDSLGNDNSATFWRIKESRKLRRSSMTSIPSCPSSKKILGGYERTFRAKRSKRILGSSDSKSSSMVSAMPWAISMAQGPVFSRYVKMAQSK